MDEIIKCGNVWRSSRPETDAKKCHLNMSNRLPLLSSINNYKDCCSEWTSITGHKEGTRKEDGNKIKDKLCLCGMKISDEYYFMNNKTKNICVMGSVCLIRHNKAVYDKYIESLRKKGTCWICKTKHNNLETHFNSEVHKKQHLKFIKDFKIKLDRIIISKVVKIENYKKRIEMLKTHKKCIEEDCNSFIKKDEPDWKIRCIECYKKIIKNNKLL